MLEVGLWMLAFKARQDALAVLTPEHGDQAKAAQEKRMQTLMSSPDGAMPRGGR